MNNMFTEANFKKIVIVLILLMGGAGIGSYAVYEYNIQHKLAMTEAKAELIRNQMKLNQQQAEETAAGKQTTAAAGGAVNAQTAVVDNSIVVPAPADMIGVDRAKEIAASTIGIAVDKLTVYDIELSNENGKIKYKHGNVYSNNPQYMLKCAANSLYYKIKIDAVNGSVLEVDIDD